MTYSDKMCHSRLIVSTNDFLLGVFDFVLDPRSGSGMTLSGSVNDIL